MLPEPKRGALKVFVASASEAQKQYGNITTNSRFVWEGQKIPNIVACIRYRFLFLPLEINLEADSTWWKGCSAQSLGAQALWSSLSFCPYNDPRPRDPRWLLEGHLLHPCSRPTDKARKRKTCLCSWRDLTQHFYFQLIGPNKIIWRCLSGKLKNSTFQQITCLS